MLLVFQFLTNFSYGDWNDCFIFKVDLMTLQICDFLKFQLENRNSKKNSKKFFSQFLTSFSSSSFYRKMILPSEFLMDFSSKLSWLCLSDRCSNSS